MAKIICKKCNATGFSKCPYCRTVFPDNMVEGMLSHILKWEHNKEHQEDITISYRYCAEANKTKQEQVQEALEDLKNLLTRMDRPESTHYPTIKQYSCDHHWVFAEGEKSDIDCGH